MIKKNTKTLIILSLIILGIAFILFGSFNNKDSEVNSLEKYTSELEEKIEVFLEEVNGISDADVIITLEAYASNENSPSYSWNSSNESSKSSIPKVCGVAVACTNGDDYAVQVKVTEIISKYLGIPSNRIKIVGLK